jgi:hypothetical protein
VLQSAQRTPLLSRDTAVSARESLRFAQVTGYQAVFVDQNTVFATYKTFQPKGA